MKAALRKLSLNISRSTSSWLMLLLLLVVLVPSACLLWFMNRSVENERLAIREKMTEVYRGHAALAQERLEAYWTQLEADLKAQMNPGPQQLFAQVLSNDLADAVICFDDRGKATYPNSPQPTNTVAQGTAWAEAEGIEVTDAGSAAEAYARIAAAGTNAGIQARALLAQARSLRKAGREAESLPVLLRLASDARYEHAVDLQGRLLVPNVELMILQTLQRNTGSEAAAVFNQLKRRLLDYSDPRLSASQRRFLIRELQKLFPTDAMFPWLSAEDMAAQYLDSVGMNLPEPGVRPSPLPGLWQVTLSGGRVVMLHKPENLVARMERAAALPRELGLRIFTPAQNPHVLYSSPLGPNLHGWWIGVPATHRDAFDQATRQRAATHIWIGFLAIATVGLLGLVAVGLIRRQVALTQLKNDLVANVTHELKTPLSSMRLLVDTLLNAPQLHEQTTREYLQLIARENLRLSRLIENFLTFSRMERNKYAFDFKEVPASAIAEGAIAAVRERFNVPGCHFQVTLAPGLPSVQADSDAMVTALLNLLDNAWKYSGDTKQISLTATVENSSVIFAVKDNGIGLSPLDTKRIFKRFYQVDQRLSRNTGGCGLGLSIVQFIVEAHRGVIRVESEPGQGSAFIISLPAVQSGESPEAKT
jgi:signal transduction histidine kinase